MISQNDIATEHIAVKHLYELAAMIAEESKPVWRWGNGEGGYILAMVQNALYEAGMRTAAEENREKFKRNKRIPSHIRYQVILRDGLRCRYCRIDLNAREVTFDHVLAQSKGGQGSIENLVVACKVCNSKKGCKDVDKF